MPITATSYILDKTYNLKETRPRGYKTFFILNSTEHENFSANKYENAYNSWHFSYLLAEKFSCSAMFSKKEFGIVSNLRFMSMKNFMLS